MRTTTTFGAVGIVTLILVAAAIGLPGAQADQRPGDDSRADPICFLPADSGPCDGHFARWFHNSETGVCEPFIYGGCLGNANNFETMADCQNACMDICSLPPFYGHCQASIARWYFDSVACGCQQFLWGGCDPNANNFATLAKCEQSCGGVTSPCQLPLQSCPCEGDPGWYYLPLLNTCAPVPDGWCGIDENRFPTEAACLESCHQIICFGDLTGNETVDVFDLLVLLSAWGESCPYWNPCVEDINGDELVDVFDLLELLAVWGTCTSPW